jgi:phage recombination protein Bet
MDKNQRNKIEALLVKRGFNEQSMTKGLFIIPDGRNISADIRGEKPIVGVAISGMIHEAGHGINAVQDIQSEVAAIMKSSQSSKASEPQKEQLSGVGIPDKTDKMLDKGTTCLHDKSKSPGTTTATCKACGILIAATIEEFTKVDEHFGGIYCRDCQTNVPATPAKPEAKPAVIRTCKVCGLELSGARALYCYQKEITFTCEDCEEKQKQPEQKEKIMEEKLPEVINKSENKLTMNTIKQYICPTATDAEAYNFLQLCLHRDLNPFLKEAYLIKYGGMPATMVVGKDAFTRKAEESGKLDGFEAGVIVKTNGIIERRIGVVQYDKDILIGGWAKIFRKDMKYPFVCEVPLSEYMKFKDGKPQSSWATMPGTMIRKVALVQALREAFTKELGGCYDAVEMGAQDNIK